MGGHFSPDIIVCFSDSITLQIPIKALVVPKLNKEDIAKDMLPKAWEEVMLYDPTMNKQTEEHTIKYANVNFWREIAKERSYNYHHRKLYRLMEGNTCAIQAQVKDLMLDTLDGLV